MVKPMASYGSETWTLKEIYIIGLNVWERRILRKINVTYSTYSSQAVAGFLDQDYCYKYIATQNHYDTG